MIPVRSLAIAALILLVFVAGVAADDCGCGGWSDDGDTGDDSTDTDDNSGDDGDTGPSDDSETHSDDDSGDESGSTNDSGSGSSSSDSGGSQDSGGGSAEEGVIWRIKGDDLFAKGMYNESLAAYEKAISFDPFSFKSWKGKGQVILALGRPDAAAEAFMQALQLDPSDAGTYALLGDARLAAGEYKDAAEQYLKALAMNPKIEGVSEKLAAAYAAENPVSVDKPGTQSSPEVTATLAEVQTVPIAVDTGSATVEETSVAVPTTIKAGFPGAITVILGVLLGLLLIGLRRK